MAEIPAGEEERREHKLSRRRSSTNRSHGGNRLVQQKVKDLVIADPRLLLQQKMRRAGDDRQLGVGDPP
jgi:hypothetical protein